MQCDTAAAHRVRRRRTSDGELLGALSTGLAQGPAVFSPDGRHLACGSGVWVQIWCVDACELAATIFRHRSGALFLAGSHYQPLRDPNDSPPGIDGFYGRLGANVVPLSEGNGLAHATTCLRPSSAVSAIPLTPTSEAKLPSAPIFNPRTPLG